jgi:2-C-methyl-D-erythritol 4-phosphate cytidylyltransferase
LYSLIGLGNSQPKNIRIMSSLNSKVSFSGTTDGEVRAVIPAAGSGIRMGAAAGDAPKQFVEILGRAVLARTLDVFEGVESVDGVVVILPADRFDRWSDLVRGYGHGCLTAVVPGGACRFDSVVAGLSACPPETGVVVIHDGARPLVSAETIEESIRTARTGRAAVAAVKVRDTVKRLSGERVETVDRDDLHLIQTPQTFPYADLVAACRAAGEDGRSLTDDAQLFERLGWPVSLIEGDPENFKMTTPADIKMAEAILRSLR